MSRFSSRLSGYVSQIVVLALVTSSLLRAEVDAANSFAIKKEDSSYRSGSIFVSSNKKNDVLIKTNVWGAVQFPGVHYIPIGTRFLDAISFAGGPLDSARTEDILLSTKPAGGSKESSVTKLSIKDALIGEKSNPILQPDDIIVIEESHTRDKIALFLAIGTFVMSAAALGLAISNRK